MATDSQLKQGRRILQAEIKRLQELVELDTLLGENIKEKVLDSEIKVKRQELEAIKLEIQTEKNQAKEDREKRKASLAADKVKFDKEVGEQAKEHEVDLSKLGNQAKDAEDRLKIAIRNTEQKVSQAQKKVDEEMERIQLQFGMDKNAMIEELTELRTLRDSMKEEIRAMQDRFGVRV